MPTTLEQLTYWINAPRETEHLEFKEAKTQYDNTKLFRHCIALANEGGGQVDPRCYRNEKLADLMRRIGVCEERGSGVDRVVTLAEFWQLPAPDFYADDQRTTAILFAHKAFNELDGKDRVRACYQHCVLSWVRKQKMTNQTLRERFKLPVNKSETVSRIIRDAIEQGRIKLDGSSASRRYARYVPWWA